LRKNRHLEGVLCPKGSQKHQKEEKRQEKAYLFPKNRVPATVERDKAADTQKYDIYFKNNKVK